ncbi:MAG: hypothetical protein Q9218_005330 [Villophora microphyllina]
MAEAIAPIEPDAMLSEMTTVDYESQDGRDDSEYQLRWTNVMNRGKYKSSENYKKVEVLLLRWDDNCDDMTTKHEVDQFRDVLELEFNWHTELHCLDSNIQLQINAIVAVWVHKYDKPNVLLLVYYAGHGKPSGSDFGHLVLHGKSSPNDEKSKRVNSIVWNKTEELLKPAKADVLEIFDCCYAGTVGLVRGVDRRFEYLAATTSMGKTPIPGEDSFTTALIWALRRLKEIKAGGRFTTDELVREIKHNAPNFPKDQEPILSDRHKGNRAGRIILSPLPREGQDNDASPVEENVPDPRKKHCLTLYLDFAEKPSFDTLESFGEELNNIFEHQTFGVNRVRLGGVRQSMVGQAVDHFWKGHLLRKQSQSQSQVFPPTLDLPTPSSSRQPTPQFRPFLAKGELILPPTDTGSMFLPEPFDSNNDIEEQDDTPSRKRRRSVADVDRV